HLQQRAEAAPHPAPARGTARPRPPRRPRPPPRSLPRSFAPALRPLLGRSTPSATSPPAAAATGIARVLLHVLQLLPHVRRQLLRSCLGHEDLPVLAEDADPDEGDVGGRPGDSQRLVGRPRLLTGLLPAHVEEVLLGDRRDQRGGCLVGVRAGLVRRGTLTLLA